MKTERLLKRAIDPVASPRARRTLIAARDNATGVWARLASLTNRDRQAPSFIVIGAQKGGTTFLFQELLAHPDVHPPLTKELHFFDDRFARGLDWYLGHFPRAEREGVTGEASPGYLFHPHAPGRVARHLPENTRVVAVLREPVARAFSHWRHERRLGFEPIDTFRAAIEAEEERTTADLARMADDPSYVSFTWRHFTYLARGRYVDQLDRWQKALGPERTLFLESDDLYQNTVPTLHRVQEFLGLSTFTPTEVGRNDMAAADGEVLDPLLRDELRRYVEPDIRRLTQKYGLGAGWL